ncbi:MAG TPA: glycosyltransferase [Chloroflexota bacterium]
MIRVLHVITSLDVGGAQKHLLALVGGLRQRGHVADVAFLKNPSLIEQFAGTGAAVYDLSARGTVSPMLPIRLARILRNGRYDIVHTHLLKADVYGAVAGVMAGTRVRIASKHNDERALLNPAAGFVHGLVSRLDHRVIVLSDYVGRYVAARGRVDGGRITRVYYGLPAAGPGPDGTAGSIRAEFGIPASVPLAVTVGRLTEQKGLVYLLEAMAIVRARLPQARLLVVGDSQDGRDGYRERLLALRDELGLAETAIFTGVRDDVPSIMRASDLLVMASLWEGFGLVFLEAMAAARPVVATRVSAVPEVVEDGKTGILVPPRDPAALAEAMIAILSDRERAKSMGEEGLARLRQNFTEERMVDEIEETYFELLRRRE